VDWIDCFTLRQIVRQIGSSHFSQAFTFQSSPFAKKEAERMPSLPTYSSPIFACQRHERGDGAVLLTLSGDLDHFSAPQLHDTTRELLEGGCRRLTVDLGQVEFMDSAGLAALLVLYRKCVDSHCELALQDETGRQENLYALAGLENVLPLVAPAREAAVP
jgi:anti-sigma B factor antagonist